ncbi:MAG: hydrogen gas-evolving membrane-bound hydrogenase subunit E [Acidimicrobiales bacterium]
MIAVLLVHVAVGVVAAALGPRLRARVFWIAALAPATTLAWVASHAADVHDGSPVVQDQPWVPGLGLDLRFVVDEFALLMLGIVSGVGVLVMAYASQYFGDEDGLGRFAALLTIFAGAMTGLVSADSLILIFVFWELTSVTSYGLIGFKDTKSAARSAAQQALIITGAGGLVLLAGLIMLTISTGSTTLSGLADASIGGSLASWAAAFILIGCFTKSAQVPFHGWLPGAMSAPTPVSAYLHSATMVKAGVFLIARLSPHLYDLPPWRPMTLIVGLATMAWGGYRALRQTDLKLLLAYGTVSQLGMLVAVFGAGTPKLLFAGTALLAAHAVFKASLFMVVGIIDHSTHTREISELSGLRRSMPLVAITSVVGGASMAGIIGLAGFLAKEAAIVGLLDAEIAGVGFATAVFVGASALTGAYTLRFLWGAFTDKRGVETSIHTPGAALVAPAALLMIPTIVLGLADGWATRVVRPAAVALEKKAEVYELVLWPGFKTAFVLSIVAVVGGAALFAVRRPLEAGQARLGRNHDAAGIFQGGLRKVLAGATRFVGVIQPGSLPIYLAVILLAVVTLPLFTVLGDVRLPADRVVAESPLQFAVVAATMLAAGLLAFSERRFAAVLLLGGVGLGSASLFVIQGAPDLALTQLLVETVSVAIYVFVLRHLPARFKAPPISGANGLRALVAAAVGVTVFVLTITAVADRDAEPVDAQLTALSYPEADGSNIVNVTLVDFRGFDTVGEALVLVVAGLGVVSLVRSSGPVVTAVTRGRRRRDPDAASTGNARSFAPLVLGRPSVVLDTTLNAVFHTIILFSVYLHFAGHNQPGGGFIAGLVAGVGLVLRVITGRELLRSRLSVPSGHLLGIGVVLVTGTALASMILGNALLEHHTWELDLPVLGTAKTTSALVFDTGIYLVVVGVVATLIEVLVGEPDAGRDDARAEVGA